VDANPILLGDADHIYENQLIFIPQLFAAAEITPEAS
jgi:hypothetical protein